jgi:alpha-beta hydrolase superfamily lysophospholipase
VTESIEIRTVDDWSLRAELLEAAGPPAGVAVLAHAAMARRSEFDRPRGAGLARFLSDRGWQTIAFDFRGHGESRPVRGRARPFRYDDFVEGDMAAACDFARWQAGGDRPVVVVGHSMGGAVALASIATGRASADAVVGIASNVWLRALEPSPVLWHAKRALLAASLAVARRAGRAPARMLRMGSDDESLEVVEDFERFARTGRWTSAEHGVDYLAALERIAIPVLVVASVADWFECRPESAARFAAHCGGRHELLRVDRGDGGARAPDHMGLVTGGRARGVWERVEAWMRAATVSGSR